MNQKEYYNKLDKEIRIHHKEIMFTSEWLEKTIVEYADVKNDLLVLDAGCGRGKLEEKLKGKCKIIGVDISAGEISKANRGKFLVSDVSCLPFNSNVFDRIISMEVVEHLPSKDKVVDFFEETYRVLKPGGVLSLSTPNANNLIFFFTHALRGKRNPNTTLHPIMFSSRMLKQLLKNAGFEIKYFKTYLFPLPIPRYEYILPQGIMKILHYSGSLPVFGSVSVGFVVKAIKSK